MVGLLSHICFNGRLMIITAGDHRIPLNIPKNYQSVKGDSQWCSEHFINQSSMKEILVSEVFTVIYEGPED
jgi:hypothetical protein